MKDGIDIHIPASLVGVGALVVALALAFMIKGQLPEAARYLKMERM